MISWSTIDFFSLSQAIIKVINPSQNIDTYLLLFDILLKVSIGFLLLILFGISYVLANKLMQKKTIRYSEIEIINYIEKEEIALNKMTVFGYSLTFSRYFREHLEKISNCEIEIHIIVPCEKLIETKLEDEQPCQSRIETLNGRLYEWSKLEKERRVKSIKISYTNEIPLEHGFLINDELLFFWYYNWVYNGEKFVQKKNSMNNRVFYLIKKSDDENYFRYFVNRITIKTGNSNFMAKRNNNDSH